MKLTFLGSVSRLFAGTLVGQLVVVLSAPVLTRLFTPEDIGLLALFSSIVYVAAIGSTLNYHVAIPIATSRRAAADIVVLCLIVLIAFSFALVLLLSYVGSDLLSRVEASELEPYKYWIPVTVCTIAVFEIVRFWKIRFGGFAVIARYNVVQPIVTVLFQFGFHQFGVIALLVGQVVGRAIGLIEPLRTSVHQIKGFLHRNFFNRAILQAVEHRRFPLFSTWSDLFNQVGQQMPIVLLASLFGVVYAGFYSIAFRVLAMPVFILGKAIAEVFYSRVRTQDIEGSIGEELMAVFMFLLFVSSPFVLLLILIGPGLFEVVFGENWRESGEFVRLLAPMLFLTFITTPIDSIMLVKKKNHEILFFQIVVLLVRIGALYIGSSFSSASMAIFLFSIGSAVCYLGLLFRILGLVDESIFRASKYLFLSVVAAAFLNLPVFILLVQNIDSSLYYVFCMITLVMYCWYYFILGRKVYQRFAAD